MEHKALSQIVERMDLAKEDSDTAYFISLLCYGEALLKTLTAAMIAGIGDDHDRNRYRLEHSLIRASGVGDWGRALDDCLIGTASQFLLPEARSDRNELTRKVGRGEWQYDATAALKETLNSLDILSEEVPTKTSFQRWALLFATLRNKTRGHGALVADKCSAAGQILRESLSLVGENAGVLGRPWVFLHQNLSGKYRVSPIAGDVGCFDHYKTATNENLKNGIYIHFEEPAKVPLIETTAELRDFYFVNGGLTNKKYDLISYSTGNTQDGDAAHYSTPPGQLPASETEGFRELDARGNCFSNVPPIAQDYVNREELE